MSCSKSTDTGGRAEIVSEVRLERRQQRQSLLREEVIGDLQVDRVLGVRAGRRLLGLESRLQTSDLCEVRW